MSELDRARNLLRLDRRHQCWCWRNNTAEPQARTRPHLGPAVDDEDINALLRAHFSAPFALRHQAIIPPPFAVPWLHALIHQHGTPTAATLLDVTLQLLNAHVVASWIRWVHQAH